LATDELPNNFEVDMDDEGGTDDDEERTPTLEVVDLSSDPIMYLDVRLDNVGDQAHSVNLTGNALFDEGETRAL
jgi:hypothetical protein